MARALPVFVAFGAACLVGLAGCTGDGGTTARSGGSTPASSRAGEGPGPSGGDPGSPEGDAATAAGVTAYRRYAQGEVSTLRTRTTAFTDAVRAGSVAGAKDLYAPSRASWERIAPIAGLVSEIDDSVDGEVDDFAGPTDPSFTGWHRLEYLLWVKNSTAGAKPFADRLDRDLATLAATLADTPVTAQAVTIGAGDLVARMVTGKVTGTEDRYSRTDLWDITANVDGCRAVLQAFEGVLAGKDHALLGTLRAQFAAVDATLVPYQLVDGGWLPFTALTKADRAALRARLAALAGGLAKLPMALGVA